MTDAATGGGAAATPRVADMQVIPVAGQDSMLLNLCGAHDDAMAMQYLVPGWKYDPGQPSLGRHLP